MKTLLAALLVLTALAGCTAPPDGDGDRVAISHVHGLAYDPDADAVYVATHHGLARGLRDGDAWSWTYLGDRYDYMGFTRDAETPGVFYSSGHPDHPADYGAVHLGLRRSVDGGETWEQRSLKGQVDFHALTALPGAEGWLAGYWKGDVKVTRDGGATWTDHPGPGVPVAALAGAPDRLLAGTGSGLHEADVASFQWSEVETEGLPSVVTTLAAGPDGETLFATAGDGSTAGTYRSRDGGVAWSLLTHDALRDVRAPVHFAVDRSDASHVLASTGDAHILESRDGGETWSVVREA